MALRVIGTGFGRTGTDSMREALGILGFGPCHHMRALTADPEHRDVWREVAAGGAPNWEALLGDFGACVDWPTAAYWPDLIEAFPDAKVLLTWRTPESWWKSFSKTILPSIVPGNDPDSVGERLIRDQVFGGHPEDAGHAMAIYRANVGRVLAEVQPGRLVLHRLGDGWGPLCAGLGVPVPDTPYPHSNSTDEFNRRRAERQAK